MTGWRLYYQLLLGAPWLGERVVARRAVAAGPRCGTRWTKPTHAAFLDVLDPAISSCCSTARSCCANPGTLAGAADGRRIELPVRVLFGRDDAAQDPRQLRGLREHAPDSGIELVDASHWIVDERPDLVADRALPLFA